MTDWKETLVSPSSTIHEALEAIDQGALQVALVADEERHLRGTVTDGDVRRGILQGVGLDDRIETVMNSSPTTVSPARSREEILSLMQNERLHQLPVVDDEGRIVGLEVLDELLEPEPRDNPVVLMAGGLGTRLRPLTEERPKPLVEVGGQPILETILENLISQGFHRFYLSVNYKAEMIREYFGDGADRGVEITYLREEERLGTAGPLHLLPEVPSLPIIVMNADLLTKLDFTRLIEFHDEHGPTATMCVRDYDVTVPYGVVETEEHRIVDIEEKPSHRFFVNAGVYALEPEVVELVAEGEYIDMPEIFEMLSEEGHNTAVFPIREYWTDVGRVEDVKNADEEYDEYFSSSS